MNTGKRKRVKNLIIFFLALFSALCVSFAVGACRREKEKDKSQIDFGTGGIVTEKDRWNIYDGLVLGFVNAEDCPHGEIVENRVVPELNAEMNERHYMVTDFTIQAPQDNDGRGSVTAEVKISPSEVVSAKVYETNTGNVTEETIDGVTTIKAVYKIPDMASVARKVRLVISIDAVGRDLVNIGFNLNCPPGMPAVSAAEVQKQAAIGCAEHCSSATYYDGEAISCQVVAVADEGVDRLIIPNMIDGKYVRRVVSFSKSQASYIAVPDSVIQLDRRALSGCTNLKSFFVHGGLTNLGDELFDGCDSLECVTVDESNPEYYSRGGVLYDKAHTRILWVPNAVKGEITVCEGVTEIADRTFADRTGLTCVNLPVSLKEIGNSAFSGCTGIKEIIYGGTAEQWDEVNKNENWTDCNITVRFAGGE